MGWMRWASLAARLTVGGVWVAAGALKLPDPAGSVRAVRAYELLPEAVVPLVGHLLPVLEILVGVCLLLGLLVRPMAVVSALMFAAFVFVIASVWARGLSIDCGCFGGGGQVDEDATQYPWELARDTALMLLSALLVWRPASPWSLDGLLFGSPARAAGPYSADQDTARLGQREET